MLTHEEAMEKVLALLSQIIQAKKGVNQENKIGGEKRDVNNKRRR